MTARGASDRPVTFQGEYNSAITYHPRQMITYVGGIYMAVARSTGSTPDPMSTTPWLPLGGGGGSSGGTLFGYDYAVVT